MIMRILVFEPGSTYPQIHVIDGTYESMQRVVGGYFEPVYVPECGPDAVLLVDADGLLKKCLPNRIVDGRTIVGTFMLCKTAGDKLVGLGEQEALDLRDVCALWPPADHA